MITSISKCRDMSDPEATKLSQTWATWVKAYSDLRQLPLEPCEHGWWIDVGKPQQSGRYILRESDISLLQQLAERVTDTAVHFELPMARCLAEQVLSAGWNLAAPEYLMTVSISGDCTTTLPGGYQLLLEIEGTEIRASCVDEDGHPLSRGVCKLSGHDAVFDQVVTERAARRQGLASAVMSVLAASAFKRGARRGVLLATAEGRPFYEALGWTLLSEVSKVISPMESRAARHLRIIRQ
jgi:GNAT superfamily N-acetyltransferase